MTDLKLRTSMQDDIPSAIIKDEALASVEIGTPQLIASPIPVEIFGVFPADFITNFWLEELHSSKLTLPAENSIDSLEGQITNLIKDPQTPLTNLLLCIMRSNPEGATSHNVVVSREQAYQLLPLLTKIYKGNGVSGVGSAYAGEQVPFQFTMHLNNADLLTAKDRSPKAAERLIQSAREGMTPSIDFEHAAVALRCARGYYGQWPATPHILGRESENPPPIYSSTYYHHLKNLAMLYLPDTLASLHVICANLCEGQEFTQQQHYGLYRKARISFEPLPEKRQGWSPYHLEYLSDIGVLRRGNWSGDIGRSYVFQNKTLAHNLLEDALPPNVEKFLSAQRAAQSSTKAIVPEFIYSTALEEFPDDASKNFLTYNCPLIHALHICSLMPETFTVANIQKLARNTNVGFYPKAKKKLFITPHHIKVLIERGLIERNGRAHYKISNPERVRSILESARVDADGNPYPKAATTEEFDDPTLPPQARAEEQLAVIPPP